MLDAFVSIRNITHVELLYLYYICFVIVHIINTSITRMSHVERVASRLKISVNLKQHFMSVAVHFYRHNCHSPGTIITETSGAAGRQGEFTPGNRWHTAIMS